MSKNKRSSSADNFVLIRGGGDLATGVALRLYRAGMRVVISELAQPLAVRRTVSFSEAVYEGQHTVEGVTARLIEASQLSAWDEAGEIPILIDPNADVLLSNSFLVVVDARLTKQPPAPLPVDVPLHIGLGPGFTAGSDCHAVIETRRSHTLGRVLWNGETQADSGQPEGDTRRVLRAPDSGQLLPVVEIGDHVKEGQLIAEIQNSAGNRTKIISPFDGLLRGLIHPRVEITEGMKIGDVDARNDLSMCKLVSDKALSIGGGVLEAVLVKLNEINSSISI